MTKRDDMREIYEGDLEAFRRRWGMDGPVGYERLEEDEKRRVTAKRYVRYVLGIDRDG